MIGRGIGCVIACIGLVACGASPEESPGGSDDPGSTTAIEPKVDPPQGPPLVGLPAPEREMRCSASDTVDSTKEAPTPELYYPEAMKRKLAKYPLLSERTGLTEVKTCSDARVFAQGYATLSKERPDLFGDNNVPAELAAIHGRPESEDVASTGGPGSGTEPGTGDGEIGVARQAILNGGLVVNNAAVRIGTSVGGVQGNWCSGVSISRYSMVSAAHCWEWLPSGQWFTGVVERQVCNPGCWGQDQISSQIWLFLSRHPNYTHLGDFDDDMALVTIWSGHENPAFPNPALAGNAMRIWLGNMGPGSGVDTYGWGHNTPSGGAGNLRVGGMTLESALSTYMWGYVQSQGPCVHDSGGPAVFGAQYAAGVHGYRSAGALCPPTSGGHWVTWARLSHKMSWIEQQLGFVCPKFNNGNGLFARCW